MTAIYFRLVKQHLSSAQVLLGELKGKEGVNKPLQQALIQSVLHFLNSACLCQLRTIADNYHCANVADIADISSLLSALNMLDQPAPEAFEMEVLINESWLGECLSAFQQLNVADSLQNTKSRSDITIFDYDELLTRSLNTAKLQHWIDAMDELVQRHNEMMAEY